MENSNSMCALIGRTRAASGSKIRGDPGATCISPGAPPCNRLGSAPWAKLWARGPQVDADHDVNTTYSNGLTFYAR